MFILPRKRKISSPSLTPDKTTNYSQTRQNIQRVLAFTLLFKIYSICTEIYHQFVYNLVRNLKDTLFIDFFGKIRTDLITFSEVDLEIQSSSPTNFGYI